MTLLPAPTKDLLKPLLAFGVTPIDRGVALYDARESLMLPSLFVFSLDCLSTSSSILCQLLITLATSLHMSFDVGLATYSHHVTTGEGTHQNFRFAGTASTIFVYIASICIIIGNSISSM